MKTGLCSSTRFVDLIDVLLCCTRMALQAYIHEARSMGNGEGIESLLLRLSSINKNKVSRAQAFAEDKVFQSIVTVDCNWNGGADEATGQSVQRFCSVTSFARLVLLPMNCWLVLEDLEEVDIKSRVTAR